jgi:hypothetical protein
MPRTLRAARRAQLHETFVDERHGIAHLLEEENRVRGVDLVGRSDGLLHEREIAADEPSGRAARLHGARVSLPSACGRRGVGERR